MVSFYDIPDDNQFENKLDMSVKHRCPQQQQSKKKKKKQNL